MTLHDAMDDYLRCLLVERGLSRNTYDQYRACLHCFHRWTLDSGYPEPTIADFCLPLLRRYVYHLSMDKGLRPRTIRGHFHALRGLGRFLVGVGAMTENPALGVKLPKLDPAQRQTVKDDEARLLLDACERQRTPRQVSFARAILSVFIYCGLRRSELLDLQIGDIDLKERSLTVRHGKGDKQRKLFLCDAALDALREWMAVRGETKHAYLFSLDRNRRIHDVGLRHLFESIKTQAGLRDAAHVLPHGLRHGMATRLLRQGADLRSIQGVLGHSMLQTTAAYLHTDEQRLKEIAPLSAMPQPSDSSPTPTAGRDGKQRFMRRTVR